MFVARFSRADHLDTLVNWVEAPLRVVFPCHCLCCRVCHQPFWHPWTPSFASGLDSMRFKSCSNFFSRISFFSFAFNPPKAISLWAYPSFVLEQAFLVADIFSSLLTPSSDVVVGSSSLALETAFLVDAMFEPCSVSFVFLAF